jgi:hypothetical protein
MSSNYKFNYFNGRGRGELTRLIFAASGTSYTDSRIDYFTEWPQRQNETPIGQLPYLELDDGVVLPQSITIARFIAKQTNLAGNTNLEQVYKLNYY